MDFGQIMPNRGAPPNRSKHPKSGFSGPGRGYGVLGLIWPIFEQIWPNMAQNGPKTPYPAGEAQIMDFGQIMRIGVHMSQIMTSGCQVLASW
jgi:hypothetical protein